MVAASGGKTRRRRRDRANRRAPGRAAADGKSTGITAIPALLGAPAVAGCAVAIAAMGCPKAIAATVLAKAAGYVPAVKGNRPTPRGPRAFGCARMRAPGYLGLAPTAHGTVGKDRGRSGSRRRWAAGDPAAVGVLWYGLRMWIEVGFRALKGLGWRWERTRRTDPDRVARHWLVLAVATL
ncbi:MAG TPA: transposase [Thermomicrobiales bacterium]